MKRTEFYVLRNRALQDLEDAERDLEDAEAANPAPEVAAPVRRALDHVRTALCTTMILKQESAPEHHA